MSATSLRKPTSAIVNALKTVIQAIQLPNTFNPAGAAFGRVELFDTENLVEAFQNLLVSEQRVCIIVPLDEKFKTESHNIKLIVARTIPIAILISDRVIGNRSTALWGDDKTPGAFGLTELVLPAVTGQLIANPNGVRCEPSSTAVMTVRDTEKKLPARVTVCLEVECVGGRLEAAVSPVT